MPLDGFALTTNDITWLGEDLSRPECVLAERDGTVWCSDDRGGVSRIAPDGRRTVVGKVPGLPNGLALEAGGAIVIANIGEGKVQRLHRNGRHEVVLDNVAGKPLGAVNFVYRDGARLWITVSTLTVPLSEAVQRPIPDGYILVLENGAARIAAEGFCFTNEVRVDRARRHLYVAETARGRIVRLPLSADGTLGPPETYGLIAPDRSCRCVFEDPSGSCVNFPASLCFAGPDLKTVYIGSIRMKRLGVFRSPVAGEPLAHWSD
jgi:gluconolactonase